MPFKSAAQQRWMFANKPKMARAWASVTNFKTLPERAKRKTLKKIVKSHMGKGGPIPTSFSQAAAPIDLLKSGNIPPTAAQLPKSKNNY